MVRRLGIVALAFLTLVPGFLAAQSDGKKLPMTGTVLNAAGTPQGGATIALVRHTGRLVDSGNGEILAQSRTDAQGQFSLGEVALKAELEFPQETAMSIEYQVYVGQRRLDVIGVNFTAPRTNAVVTSVAAEIRVRQP